MRAGSRRGRIPVWLPLALCARDRRIPQDWSITSDGLAARLAERLGAPTVLLVKSCAVPGDAPLAALVDSGIVDPCFAEIVDRAALAWRVLGAGEDDALAAALGVRAGSTPVARRARASPGARAEARIRREFMTEQLLFLTGRLAEPRLKAVVEDIGLPDGTWQTNNLGIKVAALMTEAIVRKRLPAPIRADRVLVPGRSRMDLESLGAHYGVPFERGPDELIDLPQFFGRGGRPVDLSGYDLRIFAEIVEAPLIGVDDIVARALR